MHKNNIDTIVATVTKAARVNLKDGPELLPTFFVGNLETKSIEVIGTPFQDESDKDKIAHLIRRRAAEIKADFVVFVSESWTLPTEWTQDYLDNQRKYRYVGNHPKAFEIVSFILETKTESRIGVAKILPNREMDEVKWTESPTGHLQGRFSQFLGPKAVK